MTERPGWTRLAQATAVYKTALEIGFVSLPLALVGYLHFFQSPPLFFRDYLFHEAAITVSIVLSVFAAWVAYRCYRESGEPALRHLTLAFLGFALVYAPHGVLTRHAAHDLWLFILFGPASRVVMAGFLLTALLRHGAAAEPQGMRGRLQPWLPWLILMVAVDAAVVVLAGSPIAGAPATRLVLEGAAILLCVGGIVVIRRNGLNSHLMWLYQVALVAFATSSFGFLLTSAWTHLWWLSHAIFAGGFFVLSFGLARAFLTTQSFAHVYDAEEMSVLLAASEAAATESRAAEARLRTLFDASPIGIVVTGADGRVIYCNRRQADMLGFAWEMATAADERAFYDDADARDRLAAEALIANRSVAAEMACRRADGSRQWSHVTWTPIMFAGQRCLVAWTIDVTDRWRAAKAMEQAKHAAEVANRTKTEFLAAMSHELRTPLNAINGFAETMAAEILGPIGNDRYKAYVQHILDSGRHLTELINDVLDVAKVETGRVELRDEQVSLPRAVGAALTMIGDRAREGGLRLVTELPSDLPILLGDELRIKQVLLNLLSNAVKFTPAGGTVTVRAWRQSDGPMVLTVADTGIGISPEDRDKAMAPFSQVDSGLERRYEGLGLGLPLARNLVELHDGTLELDSVPGQGTVVTLRFPARRVAA
jgi:PAS domain S-box-containing protein